MLRHGRQGRGAPAGLVSLAVVLFGTGCCGPKLETVVQEHRERVERQLAPLASIQQQVLQLPRLLQDAPIQVTTPLVFEPSVYKTGGNTAILHAEDLPSAEELGYVWARIPSSGLLNRCGSIVRRGHEVFDPAQPTGYLGVPTGSSAEYVLKRCEEVRYVVVVRTVEFVEPTQPVAPEAPGAVIPADCTSAPALASASPSTSATASPSTSASASPSVSASSSPSRALGPSASESRRVFQGGLARGEVHVFALEGAKYAGGFRFEVMNASRLEGTDVAGDLKEKMSDAVLEGLRVRVPGTEVRK